MIFWLTLTLLGIGLVLSMYAVQVEHRATTRRHYKAVCDLNARVSCSKAFTSRYGHHFGISNAHLGILFYIAALVLLLVGKIQIVAWLALFAAIGSIYLAYMLYVKLKDFCLVCTAIYLVNFALAILLYKSL